MIIMPTSLEDNPHTNMYPPWADLPELPLFSVASRLPSLPDFSSFRHVCSTWRTASDSCLPFFLSSHAPLLCSVSYDRLFCPARGGGHFLTKEGACREPRRWAVGSSAGYLILAESSSSSLGRLLLANPITGEELHAFPEAPHVFSRAVVMRTARQHCMMVAFDSNVAQFCCAGDETWRVWEFPKERGVGPIRNMGVLGEKMFGLTVDGDLAGIELAARPQVKLLEGQRLPLGRFQGSWLGACGEDLIAVTCTYKLDPPRGIDGFVARRYNFLEGTWEKVKELGGRALFVDMSWGVMSEKVGAWGGKGDCVYFTDPMKNIVGIFDLKDGSIKEVVPSPPSCRPVQEFRWDLAVWILPSLCL